MGLGITGEACVQQGTQADGDDDDVRELGIEKNKYCAGVGFNGIAKMHCEAAKKIKKEKLRSFVFEIASCFRISHQAQLANCDTCTIVTFHRTL